jgi:hypothetical protein
MTEQEWLQAADPQPMLEFLWGRASDRKLRLFGVACCRRVWGRLVEEASRRAVTTAEDYADGLASDAELDEARLRAGWAEKWSGQPEAADAAAWTASREAGLLWVVTAARRTASVSQAALLRDILGNPFRPVTLDPAWLTWHDSLLVSMARRMYESRDFTDMPVLADALEEAGCQDQNILGHCRSGGGHVRGCWVVDLLLGKE